MIINQQNFTNVQCRNRQKDNVSFSSKDIKLRQADDICRSLMNEFPLYLSSKLRGFSCIDEQSNLLKFSDRLVGKVRDYYYHESSINRQFYKEFDVMKRYKVGNCAECSDIAYAAFKMNGYKDVERLDLYAYNTKTKTMRDLDHTVVGLDFGIPKDYEFCPPWILSSKRAISPDYRIYPKRESIIVDMWSGITGYAHSIKSSFNQNRGLVKNVEKEYVEGKQLLRENEELCYVPIKDGVDFSEDDLSYLRYQYSGLVKPANKKSMPDAEILEDHEYKIRKFSDNVVKRLRYKCDMKLSPSVAEYNRLEKEYREYIYNKYRIRPIEEIPQKEEKSFWGKAVALFKKIF